MKQCVDKTCLKIQPLINFHKKKDSKDGHCSVCKKCAIRRATLWGKQNPTKFKLNQSNYAHKDIVGTRKRKLDWKYANLEKSRQSVLTWQKNNPDKVNAKTAKRRALKLNATPNWLNEEQIQKIVSVYSQACELTSNTNVLHVVDHIVPLNPRSKFVCGLHVPWNLQVITAEENYNKSDKVS